ncbi:MAG: RluA family pseudouridine synthase [Shimia sp.]|uniref:RluA family pseudouridine synthase n=1 Tax=Shimia sp. TaxID=1954381 RepID=UPI00405872E7
MTQSDEPPTEPRHADITPYEPPMEPLSVLHEDSDVVVVDKPSGLLSVPGRGAHLADCLITRVQAAFPTALLVHRLDRDTSGVMVFALTAHAQRHLSMQFEQRKTRKTYVARVWGQMADKTGTVDLPLIVDWPNRPLQMVDHENGKPAVTEYRVLKVGEAESRVRLFPKTGRSHQLRVHMLALGHVILGDPLYAKGEAGAFDRLMLHSEELRFNHPENGKGMSFRAKAPF